MAVGLCILGLSIANASAKTAAVRQPRAASSLPVTRHTNLCSIFALSVVGTGQGVRREARGAVRAAELHHCAGRRENGTVRDRADARVSVASPRTLYVQVIMPLIGWGLTEAFISGNWIEYVVSSLTYVARDALAHLRRADLLCSPADKLLQFVLLLESCPPPVRVAQ